MKNHVQINIRSLMIAACLLLSVTKMWAQDETADSKFGMNISFIRIDTVNTIKASIKPIDSTADGKLVKDIEVKFFAKKSFGLLPIGDAQTTDTNGIASVDFPTDIPGDSAGYIQIVAKVEDDENVGSLECNKSVKWGVPTYFDSRFHKRALWGTAANAPLPLVLSVTFMVVLVWGVIFYILTLLFKISKS